MSIPGRFRWLDFTLTNNEKRESFIPYLRYSLFQKGATSCPTLGILNRAGYSLPWLTESFVAIWLLNLLVYWL